MSILEQVAPGQVHRDPFPHLVIENAIDEDLCDQLIREFPSEEIFTKLRTGIEPVFGTVQVADPLAIKLAKTLPYRKNIFVMLLNTPRSIQG